uniref:Uncharacterized protein n=1 Tax=Rhizophora mucronata TaxID=61149 RepID=A0A2P2KN72_RHIMU
MSKNLKKWKKKNPSSGILMM